MAPTKGGRISGIKTSAPKSVFPGNSWRAATMASGIEIKIERNVVTVAMVRALNSPHRRFSSRKTSRTW